VNGYSSQAAEAIRGACPLPVNRLQRPPTYGILHCFGCDAGDDDDFMRHLEQNG
jgi:hypothetical protein